jgi:dipeptidyl aminopeptidase/acylaminoacyl peptidase
VFVRPSLNDPPAIWAIDGVNPARELWDPNPQLRQMQLGQASPYEWRDDSGRDWSGILVKPVDYRPGVRYPLVIQLYNYNAGEFITDGLYPTAFAAREFADVGFVVLQVKKRPDTVSEQDPQIHLEAYSSAIERLSDEGLIDRTRVGVVGFSLTCWYVVNALIKRPDLFAAATIADGIDYSYMQYMLFAVEFYPLQRQMDKVRGHSPIGAAALRHWLDEAPGFNLDRVRTPVRIEGIGPSSVLQEWELYSSLRLQRKPVDLVYFPSGTHIHQLPLERLESQQGDIDWFRFWLQNEEDPDPSKRTEYQRWEAMRSARDHEQDNRSNARQ